MKLTKEYLHSLFDWTIPETGAPHFTWAVSPDGIQPPGGAVNTSPVVKGQPKPGFIRIRGILRTIDEVKDLYEV